MQMTKVPCGAKPAYSLPARVSPGVQGLRQRQVSGDVHIVAATKGQKGRWKGLDEDISDDQQDITRGRNMVDSAFQGGAGMGGTHNAIMSTYDYISTAARNYNNIEDGFYISPAFLDKITIHVAKNFMNLPKIKVPLILGIWGGKGQGKTFQCGLAFKKLGIAPIVMSAGELESGNAGEPAKLIRQRYREASDIIKKGKMCALFINDLDAGAGRFGLATQYTVNNQMVNATLMNIADNPTNVQLPGVYKQETIPRVPIICTGNDFSTLYAPLIRDGRMEKYYWNPTREDRVGVCMGIFHEDNVNRGDVEQLVDAFPGQSIDFFGALRARVYDDKVREFITSTGVENLGKRLINSKEGKVTFDKPSMSLDVLMKYGKLLVNEQENVKRVQLADAYLSGAELAGVGGSSLPEDYEGLKGGLKRDSARSPPPPPARAPPPPPPQSQPVPVPVSYTPAPPPTPSPTPPSYSSNGASAGQTGSQLTSSDLAAFKVDDLMQLCRKKGVAIPRNPTRDLLVQGLLEKKATLSDLSKGMLVDICVKMGLSMSGDVQALASRIAATRGGAPAAAPSPAATPAAAPSFSSAPAPAPPAPSRWSPPARSNGSNAAVSDAPLTLDELNVFKVDDLMSLCRKLNVTVTRNSTKSDLVNGLLGKRVTLGHLTKGQLIDMCMKLGQPTSGDVEQLKARIKGAGKGSGSAASTPAYSW